MPVDALGSRSNDDDESTDLVRGIGALGRELRQSRGRWLVLSLPMVLPRLKEEGFKLCLWSPKSPQPLQQALQAWRAAAPELGYSENALSGRALIVHPN